MAKYSPNPSEMSGKLKRNVGQIQAKRRANLSEMLGETHEKVVSYRPL